MREQPGATGRDVHDDVGLQLGDRRPEVVVDAAGGAQVHPVPWGEAGRQLVEHVDGQHDQRGVVPAAGELIGGKPDDAVVTGAQRCLSPIGGAVRAGSRVQWPTAST